MKKALIIIFLFLFSYIAIYMFVVMMMFSYEVFNIYVSTTIDLLVIVTFVYAIDKLIKKIDN
jgi:hypothetical protein